MNPTPFSRRRFLQTTALGTLGFPAILRRQSPGSKLNIVIIGCGGRGGSNMSEMLGENIVALCDVNAKNMRIPNAPDAERFLRREYRAGWKLA
jgi:hypothetical protein